MQATTGTPAQAQAQVQTQTQVQAQAQGLASTWGTVGIAGAQGYQQPQGTATMVRFFSHILSTILKNFVICMWIFISQHMHVDRILPWTAWGRRSTSFLSNSIMFSQA